MGNYRYTIRRNDTTYYKCDNEGPVTTQSRPYYYEAGIANFDEQGIRYKRNIDAGGFTSTYMENDYEFKANLQKVMRHIFFKHGVDGVAILRVERLKVYKTKEYELDYESQVDFQDCSSNFDQFLAGLMEGGVSEKLKSRMGVSFDVGTKDGYIQIVVPPQMVRARCRFISVTPKQEAPVVPNRPTLKYNFPGYAHVDEVITEVLESPNFRPIDYYNVLATVLTMAPGVNFPMEFGQPYQQEPTSTFEAQGIQKIVNTTQRVVDFLLQTNVTIYNFMLRGPLNVYLKNTHSSASATFAMKLYYMASGGGAPVEIPNTNPTVNISAASDVTHTFNIDIRAASIPANSVLYLAIVNLTPTIVEVEWMAEGGMPLVIDFQHFTSPFTVNKAKKWKTAGDNLVKMATDEVGTFKSDLLTQDVTYKEGVDCKPANLALFSSECIKGVENPKILVSWAEYVKATDVMLCAGWGVDGNEVEMEKRSHYYQPTKLIANLGEAVKGPMVLPAQEILYNTLNIGYKETDSDDLNGPEEYNTTLKLLTNSTRVINEKDLVSPVSASGMAMYKKYIRYYTAKDNDNSTDNELFVLQYNPTPIAPGIYEALVPGQIVGSPTITSLTNSANAVNVGLTPKRCLLRRAYYEFSHFYDSDPATNIYNLKFVSLDKNTELTSQMSTDDLIIEKSDVDLKAAATKYGPGRLFYPFMLDVRHLSPNNFRQMWAAKKNGYFITQIEGKEYKGYPIEASDKNAKPKPSRFLMLLAADNNPTDLEG